MKRLSVAAILLMYICIPIQSAGGKKIVNLLDGAPYVDKGMGKIKLVDEDYLWMMQAALKPGQAVPQHNANSNVHIIILEGEVVINLSGKDIIVKKGSIVRCLTLNAPLDDSVIEDAQQKIEWIYGNFSDNELVKRSLRNIWF